MMHCEYCQAQLLEHLYGLLDDVERAELEDHLTQCGGCREALAQARKQQGQLAQAARAEFPAVRFVAPAATILPTPQAARAATTAASPAWFRWGVAACLLLGLGGLGLPAGLYSAQQDRVESARARLATYDQAEAATRARVTNANQELLRIEQEIQAVQMARNQATQELLNQLGRKPLQMTVSGPRTPDPGAVNTYQIQVRSRNGGAPTPASLTVKVLDGKGNVLHQVADVKTGGDYRLTLPRDLPLKPNTELALEVNARAVDGTKGTLKETLKLVAPVYLTHLTTDKPMYQPGEVVHFRSLTLERFSLRPADEDLELAYVVKRPNGEEVPVLNAVSRVADERTKNSYVGPDGKPVRGLGAGEYAIEPDAKGGEYTLSVRDLRGRILPQERKFIVNVYEKPRMNKELELARRSYGPGDVVALTAKAARAEGGAVANQKVVATLNVDGVILTPENPNLRTNAEGSVEVSFKALPKIISKGEASVRVTFTDGGSFDTIVRPVPIVMNKLEVEFFPEGGDLVGGVPNRVYFQARTPLGKPAELKGRILDETNAVACDVQTFSDPRQPGANHGMGSFSFTPLEGKKYRLVVDAPAGVSELAGPKNTKDGQLLPGVKADGVVLTTVAGVTSDAEPIAVVVRSAKADRQLLVGAYCRGRLMSHERVLARKGQATSVELRPETGVGGVYRVTVFEEKELKDQTDLVPVAERLIYREPAARLNLSVVADKQRYAPGDHVTLHCQATDEKGTLAPAILMVAVVDQSVLKLADEKTYKSLPTHFLLATEVRRPEDLEHADFLIGPQKSARTALDLLLATQGWRRFVEQAEKPQEYRLKRKEADLDRLLVLNGQLLPEMLTPQTSSADAEALKGPEEVFARKVEPLQKRRLQAAEEKVACNEEDEVLRARVDGAQGERAAVAKELAAETARLNLYQSVASRVRLVVPMMALLIVGLVILIKAIAQATLSVSSLVTAVGSLGLAGVLGLFLIHGEMKVADVATAAVAPASPPGARPGQGFAQPLANDDIGNNPQPDMQFAEAAVPGPMAPGKPNMPKAPVPGGGGRNALPAEDKGKGDGKMAGAFGLQKNAKGRRGARAANRGERAVEEIAAVMAGKGEGKPMDELEQLKDLRQRKRRNREEADFDGAKADRERQLPPMPCVVREYAHHHSTATSGVRSDATETVFWHPVLVLPDGKADAAFDLSDSVTTFQVLAAGHTLDGRLGAITTPLESRLPLSIEPKLPAEVTASDKIDVPVSIANNGDKAVGVSVQVSPTGLALLGGKATDRLTLDADRRTRRVYHFRPTVLEGDATLLLSAQPDGAPGDSVRRTFKVVPDGFPVTGAQSDMLEKTAIHDLVLPETWVKGTLKYQVTVYPSTLATLQKGLDGLLQEPCGCFEQTSTSNYPNLLILDYLKSTDQANPVVERRARDLLARGYRQLTSFECLDQPKNQKRGYEWFGGTAPAHEALTAYGLMQFRDMARVYDVDPRMVTRTSDYLMNQRDGKGGFKRNPRALDTFGRAPDHVTNAYVVWALTESGKDDVARELNALHDLSKTSKDPYFLALVANSLMNRDRPADALVILKGLVEKQHKDGHLTATETSITGSGGRDLEIETTALTLLAWLKAQRPDLFNVPTQKAVEWVGKQRGAYGAFGSTQSTILALKALIAYAHANKKTAEEGDLVLYSGDKVVARHHFPVGASDAITLEIKDANQQLKPGKNPLRIEITGKSVFPYTATWSYRTVKPASAAGCPVHLTTTLDRTEVQEGETVRLTAAVENVSGKGQGMALAVVGLPGGLTIPEDMKQLKDLARLRNDGTERGTIDFFEVKGRELILYWRDLAPGKKVQVTVDLIARVPGEYRGPASRAYLYYNADHRHWVEPLKAVIQARAAE